MARTAARVKEIDLDRQKLGLAETFTMADLAIKFALSPPEVSTVITGIRNPEQAKCNAAVSDLPALTPESLRLLARHNWHRGVWYGGK
jgi:aryl-alcohol dehydrogenase-like predicted oxidoreductase